MQSFGGHGTGMASIMGAVGNNGLEITGVAWSVPIIVVKTTDNFGVASASSELMGLEYALKRGARIVNCSWQVEPTDGTGVVALYDFFNETPTTLYVVAAGNNGWDLDADCFDYFPSEWSLPDMLVVGGTNPDDTPWAGYGLGQPCDTRADNTNYGATRVDVMAPAGGVWILTNYPAEPNHNPPLPAGRSEPSIGTSDAAAAASAVASFVWTEFPSFTNLQVKQRIMDKVDVLPGLAGWCVTSGRVNAARAVGVDCE